MSHADDARATLRTAAEAPHAAKDLRQEAQVLATLAVAESLATLTEQVRAANVMSWLALHGETPSTEDTRLIENALRWQS